jgi:small subunit ribosomal protein S15
MPDFYANRKFQRSCTGFFEISYICTVEPESRVQLHKNHSSNIGMYLNTEKKKEIFAKHGGAETNTGSTEGQVALFTYRIAHLTEHLKKNRKDYGTQRALQLLVGKRRSLLDYLKRKDIEKYRALVKELGLRR